MNDSKEFSANKVKRKKFRLEEDQMKV